MKKSQACQNWHQIHICGAIFFCATPLSRDCYLGLRLIQCLSNPTNISTNTETAMLSTNMGNEASDSSCLEKCGQTQKWAPLPVKQPKSKEGRRIKYVTSDLTLTNLVVGISLKYFIGKRRKHWFQKIFHWKRRKEKLLAFSRSNDHLPPSCCRTGNIALIHKNISSEKK